MDWDPAHPGAQCMQHTYEILMCDARFMTAGLEDVETGDRDVGKRPDNFGESGLLENEPTAPAEQAHTTQRQ